MICPKCGCIETEVVESRMRPNNTRHRRHECAHCKHRFSTVEQLAAIKVKGKYVTENQKLLSEMEFHFNEMKKRMAQMKGQDDETDE